MNVLSHDDGGTSIDFWMAIVDPGRFAAFQRVRLCEIAGGPA